MVKNKSNQKKTKQKKQQQENLTSSAQRFHGYHVLGARQRQLHHLQDGLADLLERLYADGEGQQEDVQPGDEEAHRPAQEPQDQEPQDAPQDARADVTTT